MKARRRTKLLGLLALAWAMSYYRREVILRPIFWGLGLQFVLALIILRQDVWSFVGMALLGLLIVIYLLEHEETRPIEGWRWGAVCRKTLEIRHFVAVTLPTKDSLVKNAINSSRNSRCRKAVACMVYNTLSPC